MRAWPDVNTVAAEMPSAAAPGSNPPNRLRRIDSS
jgi:hypothetical protein